MKILGIGVVGCGNISDIYLTNINEMFDNIELVAVCDLDEEKAATQAEKYQTKFVDLETLLSDERVDIILNITTPQTHKLICERALLAGKHTYVEKPLALSVEDGKYLVKLAKDKNLMIGGAPDTFLGAGIATCKKLIEDGYLGDIIGASASFTCPGHELWHPNPAFYYQPGGGPLLDMGPYYLTALVHLMGEVTEVFGMGSSATKTRTIHSGDKKGQNFDVNVLTHIQGQMRFKNGAIAQYTTSFDVWGSEQPRIEIYGTKGTLSVPDPNTFGGPVKYYSSKDRVFKEMPLLFDHPENSRGLGLSLMAKAIQENSPTYHQANGALTYHVLEIMLSILKSAKDNQLIHL